jgi:hypothetical protein
MISFPLSGDSKEIEELPDLTGGKGAKMKVTFIFKA